MNRAAFSDYSHMLVSDHQGWDRLHAHTPTARLTFLRMVLPLAVLPTLMLLYAGASNGGYYAPGLALSGWAGFALLFLAAELFTVRLMGELIHRLARGISPQTSFDSAFLLASLAAVPLWISSLTLFVPNVPFNIMCALAGIVASCAMLYHGVPAMLGHARDEDTRDLTWLTMWIGVGAWAILSAIAALPAMVR
ncbi:hypothetical protein JCM19000A_05390 [Silvimonas sp. JCM 19000]